MPREKRLFGTDGIRGTANIEPMTAETALKLGRAAAYVYRKNDRPHRFVIGKDTRLSGYLFENSLAAGICSMGDDVMLVGPLPTPGIAFITRSLRADAGIVISASHNPYEDNGIKFFSDAGLKLPDPLEARIEQLVFSGEIDSIRPTAHAIGKAFRIDDAAGRYVEFAKNSLPRGMEFAGLKIVIDCANGANYKVAPAAMKELGADLHVLGDKPDGVNINRGCGSLYPEKTVMKVKETGADVGFAFDGDGDRVIAVSEKGEILDGDHLLAVCGIYLKETGRLRADTVVTTVMANMGLDQTLKKHGIATVKTRVGDRYVAEAMHASGALLGGEQSGHIIHTEFNTTGDGLITALQVVRIMIERGRKLSELSRQLFKFPQYIQNIKVSRKPPLDHFPEILEERKKVEAILGEKGRILMRYSGTEPVVRIMIESSREFNIQELTHPLVAALRRNLNGNVKDG
jgi:phosphoglucosamine mutase